MGYPGDRQPRRQPYRPYETPQSTGDLRPEAQPHEQAPESAWPPVEERDPGQRPWSRRDLAHDPLFGPAPGTPAQGTPAHGTPAHGTTGPGHVSGQGFGAGEPAFGAGRSFGGDPAAPGGDRPFEAWQAPRGAFETSSPPSRPFVASQPQGHAFETSQPQGHAFETSRGNPFDVGQQPRSRPFQETESRSFEERGSDRPPETEKPPSQPPMERRRREPEEPSGRRRSRTPYFVAGGVVALIVAAGAGIVILGGGQDPVSTAAPASTGQPAQVPLVGSPSDKYGYTASRKSDPQPLTLNELFGHRKVTAHGRSYLMTVRRADKKCKDAVHGTGMQKALTAGQCTQFLRASFRDAPGKLIGTVGVGNLKTSSAAKKAAKAGTGGELEDYVTPLPGKDSATKLLGSGNDSYATAWSQGHYLVLLWFQYKDGHKPTKAELKALNRAAIDITEASVFSALDTRALTGARGN
ncbi:hypothetical protein OG589_42450 [Sphaerisporangium sp. NBC_01403]|uniref:hypothetical protein n=1 Tax=Sphaerisporangium sp. NBC_01403 TaxID=2903599 RepID=UPI0032546165